MNKPINIAWGEGSFHVENDGDKTVVTLHDGEVDTVITLSREEAYELEAALREVYYKGINLPRTPS